MEENSLLLEIVTTTKEILNNSRELQENIIKRLDCLEKTVDQNILTINQRLDRLEETVNQNMLTINQRLDYLEENHGKRLENIENIVTKIEKEHGEKIQVLFDYFVNQDLKYQRTNTQIQKIQKELDSHDSRIFALEFYKNEKLNSK